MTTSVPTTGHARSRTLIERRAAMSDLVALRRPLTARSVLASALLGARRPQLPVSALVVAASLFGISDGAARTCLWRMVANGELTTDNASYALAGHLLERRERIDESSAATPAGRRWDGTWELGVVPAERRAASDRLELRRAAAALHLAEIREGVWARPDNLEPARLPGAQAVVDRQCMRFRGASVDIAGETVGELFGVHAWSAVAGRLSAAMADELDAEAPHGAATTETLTYHFTLSVAVVRHLQRDPLLPDRFLPSGWPGQNLRTTYRSFDSMFKHRLDDLLA